MNASNSPRKSFTATEDMIGKYLNRVLYTDIQPIGKIVGIKSKTTLLVQPITVSENKTKMEFIPGGFAGVCINQDKQEYDYTEEGEVFPYRMSVNDRYVRISEKPHYYYDYNF